jgi:hypothetical protein
VNGDLAVARCVPAARGGLRPQCGRITACAPLASRWQKLRRRGLVRERVVLMGDGLPSVGLAQADGEPQPLLRVAL